MGQIITVNFRGDELYGFERDDGVFVALRPIAEAIGLGWGSQYNRVMRDPVLSKAVSVMKTPFGSHGQDEVCLKLEKVNGWLFGIETSRIKDPDVRERVVLYQEECYDVLAAHFLGKGHKPAPGLEADPRTEESLAIRRMLVTEARQTFDIHAARELWFRLNLPVVPAMVAPPAQGDMFTYTARKEDEAA